MLGKEPVGIGNLIELEAVREQWRQIQTSVKNHLHQASHAFLSPWAQRRDDLVIAQTCSKRLKRYGQLSRVHSKTAERAPRAKDSERVLERGLRAQGFDRYIHASATREPKNFCDHVALREIEHDVGTHSLRHRRSRGVRFDSNNKTRSFKPRARRRTKSNWSLSEDCGGVADLQLGAFSGRDARRGNVGQQNNLFIPEFIRDSCQVRLRARHEQILRLRAVNGVAKFPATNRATAL
jgi:hypothetical protein